MPSVIAVHLQTTGPNPLYDHILHFAATLYRNGVVVDTFDWAVRPGSKWRMDMDHVIRDQVGDYPHQSQHRQALAFKHRMVEFFDKVVKGEMPQWVARQFAAFLHRNDAERVPVVSFANAKYEHAFLVHFVSMYRRILSAKFVFPIAHHSVENMMRANKELESYSLAACLEAYGLALPATSDPLTLSQAVGALFHAIRSYPVDWCGSAVKPAVAPAMLSLPPQSPTRNDIEVEFTVGDTMYFASAALMEPCRYKITVVDQSGACIGNAQRRIHEDETDTNSWLERCARRVVERNARAQI